jgi:hypothetical protein
VRAIQKMASSTRRWSRAGRPPSRPVDTTKGSKKDHSSSVSRPRINADLHGRDQPGITPSANRESPIASLSTRPNEGLGAFAQRSPLASRIREGGQGVGGSRQSGAGHPQRRGEALVDVIPGRGRSPRRVRAWRGASCPTFAKHPLLDPFSFRKFHDAGGRAKTWP